MSETAARNILELDGERFKDQPHGWIQWKGTEVCIDLHCKCGAHLRVDADFLYAWKCPHCGRHYEMGSHIAVYELTPEEVAGSGRRFHEPEKDAEDFPAGENLLSGGGTLTREMMEHAIKVVQDSWPKGNY